MDYSMSLRRTLFIWFTRQSLFQTSPHNAIIHMLNYSIFVRVEPILLYLNTIDLLHIRQRFRAVEEEAKMSPAILHLLVLPIMITVVLLYQFNARGAHRRLYWVLLFRLILISGWN